MAEKEYNLFNYLNTEGQIESLQIQNFQLKQQIESYNIDNENFVSNQIKGLLKLEQLKEKIHSNTKQIKSIKNACGHELVLYLGKNEFHEDQGLAVCLECERKLYLKDIDKNAYLDPESIINIEGILPEEYICSYDRTSNVLASRAREKLLLLAEQTNILSLYEVKQNILEDLVYYVDELNYRKINPRKRARKISERK